MVPRRLTAKADPRARKNIVDHCHRPVFGSTHAAATYITPVQMLLFAVIVISLGLVNAYMMLKPTASGVRCFSMPAMTFLSSFPFWLIVVRDLK